MHMRKLATRALGVIARLASRLPWRKEFALALLFIGTPLVTGDMEVFALNLVGLGIAALVARQVMQVRSRAWMAAARQSAQVNSISSGTKR